MLRCGSRVGLWAGARGLVTECSVRSMEGDRGDGQVSGSGNPEACDVVMETASRGRVQVTGRRSKLGQAEFEASETRRCRHSSQSPGSPGVRDRALGLPVPGRQAGDRAGRARGLGRVETEMRHGAAATVSVLLRGPALELSWGKAVQADGRPSAGTATLGPQPQQPPPSPPLATRKGRAEEEAARLGS